MRTFSLLAALVLLLAACGTRGQLVLPPGPATPALLDKPAVAKTQSTAPADNSNKATPPTAP